jgi:hypothetical protein
MSHDIDFDKLQQQYELVGKLLGSLGSGLDEAKSRLGQIAEIRKAYTTPDSKMDEYHQQTVDMLQGALDRYGEMLDMMLKSGTDAIRKMGKT